MNPQAILDITYICVSRKLAGWEQG